MKARQFAGLGVLVVVALVIGAVSVIPPDPGPGPGPTRPPEMTITGIGGGKVAFFDDPEVIRILKEEHGLTVEFRRVPSLEHVDQCKVGLDYCWPSSQTATELIEQKLGSAVLNIEIIFNSPIVMYTWGPIVEALIAHGMVQKTGDTYYLVDLKRLAEMIIAGDTWASIGLPQLHGNVFILSSDPTASNTGNSFAGLLANTLNDGRVVDETTVEAVLPLLKTIFDKSGLLPNTTTAMFERFLTLGIGAAPIIVAYESNLVEYYLSLQSEQERANLRDQVVTLYPKPTVWSSHPLIALTEGGERFLAALRDPKIQRLGWAHHAFRPGVPGIPIDLTAVNFPGIPPTIDSIIQMPKPSVMTRIIEYLEAPAAARRREELVG